MTNLFVKYSSGTSGVTFGPILIPCCILSDGSRIFDKEGIEKAIAGGAMESIFDMMIHINLKLNLSEEFLYDINNRISYNDDYGLETKIGLRPQTLFDACTYLKRGQKENILSLEALNFITAVDHILQNWSDIDNKIDSATGFERFKLNHKQALTRFILKQDNDPSLQWIKTFSDAFFNSFFEFYKLEWEDLNRNSALVATNILNIVFARIENNLLEELRIHKPRMRYRRENLAEQFIDHPKLQEHLHAISTLMKASGGNERIFNQLMDKTFPIINSMEINWERLEQVRSDADPAMTSLNESLLKAVNPKIK